MPKAERLYQLGDYWISTGRNSPKYYRCWFDPATRQTRRASLGTVDLEEAKNRLNQWYLTNVIMQEEAPEEVALEMVLVRYYERHASKRPSAEAARGNLLKWSDFFPGAMVSELTPARQREFIESLRLKGYSNGYIRRILTTGRAALNRAMREQEIASAPPILVREVPEGEARNRWLTKQEVAALFDATRDGHLFMYLMLAFNTLARPQAILELKHFQVDLDHRLISFNPPGREQTKKYRPVIPITRTLLPYLSHRKAENVVHYRGRGVKSIKTTFRKARDRAGLGKEVIPYTIRHTMAMELRNTYKVPMADIAGILGHKQGGYRTTEIYADFHPDPNGPAVRAIDEYFGELNTLVSRPLIDVGDRLTEGHAC